MNRTEASAAVSGAGWRYLLGSYATAVPVGPISEALDAASRAVAACGDAAGHQLHIDLRPGRIDLVVRPAADSRLGPAEASLALAITGALAAGGWVTTPLTGTGRPVQQLEIAIDAMDIPAVLPFWRAVLGYADDGPDAVTDPAGQGPAFWFQQMDAPRPQRNRIHVDVTVPHDEAEARIAAALTAGGRLVSDRAAPAFWVLADAEGNEACVCTWQGRD